jgi:hypothetical protein
MKYYAVKRDESFLTRSGDNYYYSLIPMQLAIWCTKYAANNVANLHGGRVVEVVIRE